MSADLTDADDPVVKAALSRECECGAAPDVFCHNIISPDKPLPGKRLVHYARVERWDV